GFDELGRLRTSFWKERDVPLALAAWHVAEKPVDQAAVVSAILARWSAERELAADELVLGVADESVVPYLERELAAGGAWPRLAAGLPLERTRPLRLLRAVARYLRRAGFAELAALARESDLAAALQPGDASAPLDSYFVERLPRGARGPWIAADPRVH